MRNSLPSPRNAGRGPRLALDLAALLALASGLAGCSGNISRTDYDCSLIGQKAYVASIMSDFYLWYDRVPPVDIAAAASPEEARPEVVIINN